MLNSKLRSTEIGCRVSSVVCYIRRGSRDPGLYLVLEARYANSYMIFLSYC
jgi:hypothetical protein